MITSNRLFTILVHHPQTHFVRSRHAGKRGAANGTTKHANNTIDDVQMSD